MRGLHACFAICFACLRLISGLADRRPFLPSALPRCLAAFAELSTAACCCRGTLDVLVHRSAGSGHRLEPAKLLPIVRRWVCKPTACKVQLLA